MKFVWSLVFALAIVAANARLDRGAPDSIASTDKLNLSGGDFSFVLDVGSYEDDVFMYVFKANNEAGTAEVTAKGDKVHLKLGEGDYEVRTLGLTTYSDEQATSWENDGISFGAYTQEKLKVVWTDSEGKEQIVPQHIYFDAVAKDGKLDVLIYNKD